MRITILSTILIGLVISANAQNQQNVVSKENSFNLIQARSVTISGDSLFVFEKDVKISVGEKLQVEGEKVTWDRKANTIVADNAKKVVFIGELILEESPTGKVRYKIGEDKLYVN